MLRWPSPDAKSDHRPLKTIGIIYNFRNSANQDLARALQVKLSGTYSCWIAATNEEARTGEAAPHSDVVVSIGGDGTILRVAHVTVPHGIPILGVNTGRVGFIAEVSGSEAMEKVPHYLAAGGRIEERSTLDVEVIPKQEGPERGAHYTALNDVVVGGAAVAKVAQVEARVDGVLITTYRSDAVILATATGSTGYSLASGGPVLYPESTQMIVVPVSAHLSFSNPVIIPPDSVVELRLLSELQGLASIDGQRDHPLETGDLVRTRRSNLVARFIRAEPASAFFGNLTRRLHRAPE